MAKAARGFLATPDDEPITAVGTPGALRIDLPLMNPDADTIVVRDAVVKNVVVRGGQRPLSGIAASLTAVLAPGQTASGTLRVNVAPHTPPGTYAGEIEVAGSTRRFELTILEQVRVAIDPTPIFLEGAPGAVVRKTVLFRNLGNVTLHVRDPGPVPIGEELPFSPTATAEVAASGRAEEVIRRLLGRLFEGRETRLLKEAGVMTVRLSTGDDLTLAPGASRDAVVECTLPDDLMQHRRYRAFAPIYDAGLTFLIVATKGESQEPSAPKSPLESVRPQGS